MVKQAGRGRCIIQILQIMHHQGGPTSQKSDERLALGWFHGGQQQSVFQHVAAYGLQARKTRQLHRFAHALHLAAVLIQRVQKAGIFQLQLVQVIQIDVELGTYVFNFPGQRIN